MESINTENKNRLAYSKNIQFGFLTMLFITIWFYFFYSAIDLKDWWMENILVLLFCAILFVSQKRFLFYNTSLVFIFLFLLLHLYGARMAYTQNELGQFLKNTFQLSRNPYDRIVHFSFGFLIISFMRLSHLQLSVINETFVCAFKYDHIFSCNHF